MRAVRNSARRALESLGAPLAVDGRRAARHEYVQFLWFHCLQGENSGLARTVDLSDEGMGFISGQHVAPKERLFLVLLTPFGRISAIAKVVHSREVESGSFRIGVRLEIIPPTDKTTWATLLGKEPR
jgi:hypothetical protein